MEQAQHNITHNDRVFPQLSSAWPRPKDLGGSPSPTSCRGETGIGTFFWAWRLASTAALPAPQPLDTAGGSTAATVDAAPDYHTENQTGIFGPAVSSDTTSHILAQMEGHFKT
jgi:hypothetical protein